MRIVAHLEQLQASGSKTDAQQLGLLLSLEGVVFVVGEEAEAEPGALPTGASGPLPSLRLRDAVQQQRFDAG